MPRLQLLPERWHLMSPHFFYTCQNDVLNFVPSCPVLREQLHAVRHRQYFEPWSFAHRAVLCWGYLNFSDCDYLDRFSWLFEYTYLKIRKKVFTYMNDLILVPYCVLKTTFNCFLHFWSCFKIKSNIKMDIAVYMKDWTALHSMNRKLQPIDLIL